jgi:DNA-binding NarL/FixJ family response regulator
MPEPSQLLLFDTSSRHLDTLSFGFEKAGCTVVGTSEVATVRSLLRASRPSVLIVGVHTPDDAGFELIRSLGHTAETRNLPCVVFGRPELRNDSVAAGVFGFLSVPIFVSDIIGACRLVAATSSSRNRSSNGSSEGSSNGSSDRSSDSASDSASDRSANGPSDRFSADAEVVMRLEEVEGIYHLVRIFSVIGRSAVVQAVHDTKRAELRFIDGVLTAVQLGAVSGLPALHKLLLWDEAELKLRFKNVERRGNQLSLKPSEVLEECDRFLRDFAHEVAGLGSSRTIFAPNASRRPAPNMPSEVVPVLKQFDGRRALAQILEDSPFRVFDTLRIIKRFVADEAIVSLTPRSDHPTRAAARSTGPAALDAWFERSPPGRQLDAAVLKGTEPLGQGDSQASSSSSAAELARGQQSPDGTPGNPSDARPVGEGGSEATALGRPLAIEGNHVTTLRLVPSAMAKEGPAVEAARAPSVTGGATMDFVSQPPLPSTASASSTSASSTSASSTSASSTSASSTSASSTSASSTASATTHPFEVVAAVPDRPPIENVTFGEIRVQTSTVRKTASIPAAGAPSVFVDLAVQSPLPPASTAAEARVSAPTPALPEPVVNPMPMPLPMPLPVARVVRAAVPGTAIPAIPPAPSRVPAGPASAMAGRPPPRPFDDVESDFFDREADLYRRDSIESFDDLEGAHARAPTDRDPPGKP